MSAANVSDGGAEFTVTLPIERSSFAGGRLGRASASCDGTPNLTGIRVLVVDERA